MIKLIPKIVKFGAEKEIERTIEFKKLIEALLLRAKSDLVDGVRV